MPTPLFEYATTAMSTVVSVQIMGEHPNATALAAESLDWFRLVEASCSRFDPASELMRLCHAAPGPAHVSPLLFEVLRVALAVAQASEGAFDPTLGSALHARGFNRHWSSHEWAPAFAHITTGQWRDIVLDETALSVQLPIATALDLGGIAKGFALDLAARALAGIADCCVVAGGDLLCRGLNANGRPWCTAVLDPFRPQQAVCTVTVGAPEYAVCTSGDYVRRTAHGHHLLDARHQHGVSCAAGMRSATVIAPQAAIADALATAAFVMGPQAASAMLKEQMVDAWLIDAEGTSHIVTGWGRAQFTPCSS
ncbi:FAD:protein FMN transferase [Gemmatimonas sp.]